MGQKPAALVNSYKNMVHNRLLVFSFVVKNVGTREATYGCQFVSVVI